MSSYRQILYHIVFRTKSNKKTITNEKSHELYNYIWGIIKSKNCKLYCINGTEDHIHLLTDLHPSVALADFIRDIKSFSTLWIKSGSFLPFFEGWSDGYAALTYASKDKDMVVRYIRNQREHHRKIDFQSELRDLLKEHGVAVDEKYFP